MPRSIGGRHKFILGEESSSTETIDKALRAGKWGKDIAELEILSGNSTAARQLRADMLGDDLPGDIVRRPYTAAVWAYVATCRIESDWHREKLLAKARELCMEEQREEDREGEGEGDDDDVDVVEPTVAPPVSAPVSMPQPAPCTMQEPVQAPQPVQQRPAASSGFSGSFWNAPVQVPNSETLEGFLQRAYGFEKYNRRIISTLKALQAQGMEKNSFQPEHLLPMVEESFYLHQASNRLYFIASTPKLSWGDSNNSEYLMLISVNGVKIQHVPGVHPKSIPSERPHEKAACLFSCAFWNRVVPAGPGTRVLIAVRWHGFIQALGRVDYTDVLTMSLEVLSTGEIRVTQKKDHRTL